MRTKVVAGNWKMNLSFDEARQLYHALSKLQYDDKVADLLIAPPAIYLSQFSFANSGDLIIAAQNCHEADAGAYTGEWSASMLSSIRVDHCIIGHSERRAMFGDTNDIVAQKARSCFDNNVIPIVCCGESLEERELGKYFDVVTQQISTVLGVLKDHEVEKMIIAYEPVWAIGTGRTASSDQAQEMHQFIRKSVALEFSEDIAQKVRILYGGSVKPENASELFAQPDVDGGLVGGASLKYESFKAIFEAAF